MTVWLKISHNRPVQGGSLSWHELSAVLEGALPEARFGHEQIGVVSELHILGAVCYVKTCVTRKDRNVLKKTLDTVNPFWYLRNDRDRMV